jgi:hypothetical protein
MLPRDKLLTRPCLGTSQNELYTYKLQTKYKSSRFNPMSKDQGCATLSTTRGGHLLLLDPIPSLHHAEEKIIRNEKLQNRIELKTTVVILMLY